MYIIWNAIKNLERNKGRNALMAMIIFAIIVSFAVSIVINVTTESIIKDYKGRFSSEISIEYKPEESMSTTAPKSPTSRQVLDFGKSDYLKTAEYTTMRNGYIVNDKTDSQSSYEKERAFLTGSSRDYINQEFKSGAKKIIDGKKYKKSDECLISDEYAEKNNLSVGDSISIDLMIFSKDDFTTDNQGAFEAPEKFERKTFKISGIYKNFSINSNIMSSEVAEILVDFDTLINLESFDIDSEFQVFGTFFLKDPEMLDAFTKEIRKKGLSDDMQVLTDEAGYKQVVGPVEGLAKISSTFMVAVLILGCAILLLLSFWAIRERKYEIGVLRAMGMKKIKIAVGLLTETIIITVICLAIGLSVSSVASQPIADSLLAEQVKIAEEIQNQNPGMVGINPDKATLSPLSKVDVNLDMQAVTQIILASLLIAGVSSITGIFYITRYEPMRILSERN